MTHSEEIKALAEGIADRDAEIERLKALLARAADALEHHQMVTGEIIVELRKAAK
jgi:hypothetical protein